MAKSRIIITERLRIVPFSEKHLTSRYVSWLNDRNLMRFSENAYKRHTMQSCREYYESFIGTPHFFWALEEVSVGIGHIGNMNAYVEPRHQVADVGILLGETAARGCGLGLEAWRAVCSWLTNSAGIRKISAGTLAINKGMLNIMNSSGMVPDGIRERHRLVNGLETDIIHMAFFTNRMHAADSSARR